MQNDNGKSDPTSHSGYHHQSTTNKCGTAWRKKNPPKLSGNIHWQQSVKWMVSECLNKDSQIKTKVWYSHTLAYILRKPLIKWHGYPTKASTLLLIAETLPAKPPMRD